MKKATSTIQRISTLLLFGLTLILACSCGGIDPEKVPFLDTTSYRGTVSVLYEGETVENTDILVDMTTDSQEGVLTMFIHRIKFVPKMPVRVDVEVGGIAYEKSGDVISFSGNDIVPLSGILSMPKYTVTSLSGKISGGTLSFSLNFGEYPTSFEGKLVVD